MIRPLLVALAANAVGADIMTAVAPAVAIELVHNFSLLHDDIMDQDAVRRGRPALWAAQGLPSALLVGDVFLVAAFQVLHDADSSPAVAGSRLLATATQRMAVGQWADMDFEHLTERESEQFFEMATGKMGALSCQCTGRIKHRKYRRAPHNRLLRRPLRSIQVSI
jgi:geranylgeranyl diphosphate synthase, type I